MLGVGCRVWSVGCRVQGVGCIKVWGLGSSISNFKPGVQSLGFRVQRSGCMVYD